MQGGPMKITFAIVLAAALAGALGGAAVGLALDGSTSDTSAATAATTPATTASATTPTGLTPEQLYRRAAPAGVVITDTETKSVPSTLFGPPATEKLSALGSGFVIEKQGDIVTNDHVVQGGSNIRVGFSSGGAYPAKVVGADPTTDIAVVRVKAPGSALHPLTFDDSSAVSVGDPVYAIGNPFGLDRTMTAGIVSASGRDIQAPDGLTIPNAIQTDAAINHGNSGGPLLDSQGHVIGITSQIQGGTVDANVGVGFAVPSNTARSVADQLIAHGSVQHAWLGVQLKSTARHPVVVAKVVPGGPAAKTSLEGDAIVSLDGKPITSTSQLAEAVAGRKPGDVVRLGIVRNGSHRVVGI